MRPVDTISKVRFLQKLENKRNKYVVEWKLVFGALVQRIKIAGGSYTGLAEVEE